MKRLLLALLLVAGLAGTAGAGDYWINPGGNPQDPPANWLPEATSSTITAIYSGGVWSTRLTNSSMFTTKYFRLNTTGYDKTNQTVSAKLKGTIVTTSGGFKLWAHSADTLSTTTNGRMFWSLTGTTAQLFVAPGGSSSAAGVPWADGDGTTLVVSCVGSASSATLTAIGYRNSTEIVRLSQWIGTGWWPALYSGKPAMSLYSAASTVSQDLSSFYSLDLDPAPTATPTATPTASPTASPTATPSATPVPTYAPEYLYRNSGTNEPWSPPHHWTEFASSGPAHSFVVSNDQLRFEAQGYWAGYQASGSSWWYYNPGTPWTDYDFTFKHVTATATGAATLIYYVFVGFQDSTHYYYANKTSNMNGSMSFYPQSNTTNAGAWNDYTLNSFLDFEAGSLIKAKVRRGQIQLYINKPSYPVWSKYDDITLSAGTQVPNGSIGLGFSSSYGDTTVASYWYVDDIDVEVYPSPTATPTASPTPTPPPSGSPRHRLNPWWKSMFMRDGK